MSCEIRKEVLPMVVMERRAGVICFLRVLLLLGFVGFTNAKPRRILMDTDVDTDDFFGLLYLLKQNRSEFDVQAVTISANSWTHAGHAVNHIYDILYMMNRDDISVGVGGDDGILDDGTILPNVGGYLPLIEQGMSTAGECRYRQAIPKGPGGQLDIDTNYGFRRAFLPQGDRRYIPLEQPTAQQVMTDTISAGPTTLIVTGVHTNVALFLMTKPYLKYNIEHIYIMGGGIRSKNPTGCCPANATGCVPQQCGDHGNLFTGYTSNPYAEFNMFGDPFAAYQVFHSGIPITLVPLDATNTIPITKRFFLQFNQMQQTYEAQYIFKSLKIIHDTWFNSDFYTSYFMWDSFTAGVAISIMRNGDGYYGKNEFAAMRYLNITVVTSNVPYGITNGSNPFFDGRANPKFNLKNGGVHSGHVQTGLQDPFCFAKGSNKGICQDGYTKEVNGSEAVWVLVAQRAKPNPDSNSTLQRAFYESFLHVLNLPQHSGRFNFTTQFPHYREVLYKPDLTNRVAGKPVVFDMDMSAGDFIALFYLLKVPVEVINLKGILVNGNGWASAATIDLVYDVLHMMGRDDIPVGLGSINAVGTPALGCQYTKAIPQGSGGFIDSDTLYGLGRTLPRSPRRYTAENSVAFGAPRNTSNPQLRQPLALEVWKSIVAGLRPGDKITVLTSSPLTNLANILISNNSASSVIQDVYVVGGEVIDGLNGMGNVFTVPANKFSEFNMFLDPLAAQKVIGSGLNITLIPLTAQRKAASFDMILNSLQVADKTPESIFVYNLISSLDQLKKRSPQLYNHMDIFLGEVLGAVFLVDHLNLSPTMEVKPITVLTGNFNQAGEIIVDGQGGKYVNILQDFDAEAYYNQIATLLGVTEQSAVIASFSEQKKMWTYGP